MAAASSAQGKAQASTSVFGTLVSWAGTAIGYASDTLNNFLGWEDLDVVDPESDHTEKGTAKDEGVLKEERRKMWSTKQFQQYIGMDVTSLLSVPVWIMEPFTMLQKMAEIMEYTELLDQADRAQDQYERFAYVVAFLVSPYAASERAWKPFNPVLGETFEVEVGSGVRYFAEQVSHHPPVAAAHAENEHFVYDLVSAPTTKFLGNSLEVYPYGRTRIRLRRTGELFSHVPPHSKAHNIVIGRTWVDSFGDFHVLNGATGARCHLYFTPCGWFSYGRYEFSGYISDKDGNKKLRLLGKWNSHLDMAPCDADGETPPSVAPRRLWTCSSKPEADYYGFTYFAHKLNSCEGIRVPLPSDSRRRPDRAALEEGDSGTSGAEKYRLEELQRAERRIRASRGDTWSPRWFRPSAEERLLPGECSRDVVPGWEWTGDFDRRPQPDIPSADDICAVGFNPWQYPDLHALVEEEDLEN